MKDELNCSCIIYFCALEESARCLSISYCPNAVRGQKNSDRSQMICLDQVHLILSYVCLPNKTKPEDWAHAIIVWTHHPAGWIHVWLAILLNKPNEINNLFLEDHTQFFYVGFNIHTEVSPTYLHIYIYTTTLWYQ